MKTKTFTKKRQIKYLNNFQGEEIAQNLNSSPSNVQTERESASVPMGAEILAQGSDQVDNASQTQKET